MYLSKVGLAILPFVFGCVSQGQVAKEYSQIADKSENGSQKTVIVFLVDGLPLNTFESEVNSKRLPNMTRFFIGEKKQYFVARTVFPSLTFPAVSSLLTESPIGKTEIIGNHIFKDGDDLSFESPSSKPKLNSLFRGDNVFSRLGKKGQKTVSFDLSFSADSTAHIHSTDLETGLAILGKDYAKVDQKIISSFSQMLESTSVDKWPDLIFVHLVGVDLTSHDVGPESGLVTAYLEDLDARLDDVFQQIENAEKKGHHKIVALLTADHGFDRKKVAKVVKLVEAVEDYDRNIKFLDEGRLASLAFPKNYDFSKKEGLSTKLLGGPGVDIVAYLDGDSIHVNSGQLRATIRLIPGVGCADSSFQISIGGSSPLCPDQLPPDVNRLYYPYFISNLSYYFAAPTHFDAVVISKSGVAFNNSFLGQHGGPTPEEIFVPLLIRNGTLGSTQDFPPLWKLLRFL